MDLGLEGRTALVLSSSRGLGLGIARGLVAEGVRVLLTGRDEAALKAATAEIGAAADYVVADLSTAEGIAAILKAASEKLGHVDILVNNTGGPPPRVASDVTAADWRSSLDAMVVPITEITRPLVAAMRARRWGRVITVASSGVVQPIPNLAISNALRAAVVGWSKSLAGDVAADGVTVNVILPGRIHTDRVDQLDAAAAARAGSTPEAVAEASRKSIPAARYGRVEEFAAVAVFLASHQAAYVTGSVLRCDGGAIRAV